eukprot:CAMPEP_0119151610 /NCGR_PEP_ID=MMETSP1310-20130426/46566_1 /TAXON_ID=464262 /ORGANISM="Genus nov. species nov., Strain RCC2339" /LENGTH=57 /DNA_ID=CAMNT_0007143895 /DNA_START=75 /DNA_END=244 /DNA_ORIENTATION=-
MIHTNFPRPPLRSQLLSGPGRDRGDHWGQTRMQGKPDVGVPPPRIGLVDDTASNDPL